MSKVSKLQTKIDEAQLSVTEKVDNVQLSVAEKIDEVQAKVDAGVEKVEGLVEKIKNKLTYGIDFVRSAVETAGVDPRNLFDIAKIVIGRETMAKPIVIPVLKGLITVQVSEKPSTDDLKAVVDANI